ncbi:hypothetical protein FISHEDRAFT_55384 [Fistulina hepatica ATCC 64428]|uniref:Uncharacterized protein n=1 Tax=Fistulina hepatica ATCC 64428 TaxID=1128425 RepID=A0A0D7AN78_9AGAR|nr:hypothetical protein FISHEDRAFT_55384 [Fistulina hepatica ATCC 64428]
MVVYVFDDSVDNLLGWTSTGGLDDTLRTLFHASIGPHHICERRQVHPILQEIFSLQLHLCCARRLLPQAQNDLLQLPDSIAASMIAAGITTCQKILWNHSVQQGSLPQLTCPGLVPSFRSWYRPDVRTGNDVMPSEKSASPSPLPMRMTRSVTRAGFNPPGDQSSDQTVQTTVLRRQQMARRGRGWRGGRGRRAPLPSIREHKGDVVEVNNEPAAGSTDGPTWWNGALLDVNNKLLNAVASESIIPSEQPRDLVCTEALYRALLALDERTMPVTIIWLRHLRLQAAHWWKRDDDDYVYFMKHSNDPWRPSDVEPPSQLPSNAAAGAASSFSRASSSGVVERELLQDGLSPEADRSATPPVGTTVLATTDKGINVCVASPPSHVDPPFNAPPLHSEHSPSVQAGSSAAAVHMSGRLQEGSSYNRGAGGVHRSASHMVDDIDDDQRNHTYHPEDDEEADVDDGLGDVSPHPRRRRKDKGKGKAKEVVDLLTWDTVEGLLANAMELMEQDSQLTWDADDMPSDDEVLLQWEGCLTRSRDAPFLVADHPDFGIYKTNTYGDRPWHIDPHECHIPLVTSFEQVEEEGRLFFPVFAQTSVVGAQHPNYEQDWNSLTDSQKQFRFWLFVVKGLPIGWHSNDPSTADPVGTFRFFEPMKVVCAFLKLVMGHIPEYCTVSVPILFCFGDRHVGRTITWTGSMCYNGQRPTVFTRQCSWRFSFVDGMPWLDIPLGWRPDKPPLSKQFHAVNVRTSFFNDHFVWISGLTPSHSTHDILELASEVEVRVGGTCIGWRPVPLGYRLISMPFAFDKDTLAAVWSASHPHAFSQRLNDEVDSVWEITSPTIQQERVVEQVVEGHTYMRRKLYDRLGDPSSHMGMGAISLDRSLCSQPSPDDSPDASDAEEKGYVLAVREHINEAILATQEVPVLDHDVRLMSKQWNESFGEATMDRCYVRFSKSEKQVIKRLWNQIHKAASGIERPMSQVLKHMGLAASVSYPIQTHNLYFKLLKAWKVEKRQGYEDLLHLDFNDFRTFAARHWKEEVQSQKMSEAELTAFTHQLQDELAEYTRKNTIYESHVRRVVKECNSVAELCRGELDLHFIAMLISTKPENPMPGYGSQVIVASDRTKELLMEAQVDMAKVLDNLATIVKAQEMGVSVDWSKFVERSLNWSHQVAGQQVSTVQSSRLAHAQNTSVLPTTLGVNNEHGSDLGEDDEESNHLSLDTLPDDDSHWQNKDWLIQAMVEKAKEDGFVTGIDLIARNKSSIADKSVNVQIIRRSAINCILFTVQCVRVLLCFLVPKHRWNDSQQDGLVQSRRGSLESENTAVDKELRYKKLIRQLKSRGDIGPLRKALRIFDQQVDKYDRTEDQLSQRVAGPSQPRHPPLRRPTPLRPPDALSRPMAKRRKSGYEDETQPPQKKSKKD